MRGRPPEGEGFRLDPDDASDHGRGLAVVGTVAWWRDAGGTGPLTVKAGPMLADAEHAAPPVTWTPDHLLDSLARIAEWGVHQLVWDLNIVATPVDEQVALLTDLAPALVR